MNTLIEKITKQQQRPSKVFLFKEEIFYKAYNQGAYLMRDTKYKVKVKKLKNSQNEVLSIGFPESVYYKLHEKFCIETFESYSCFNCDIVYNEEEFQSWYRDKINTNREDIKLITPREIKAESSFSTELTAQIINYPLANKTPRTKLNFKKCISNWKIYLESNLPSLLDLQRIRASINSYLGAMKQYRTYSIVYNILIKDRNNTLFQYGYVEAVKNKTMIYRIFNSNTLLQ